MCLRFSFGVFKFSTLFSLLCVLTSGLAQHVLFDKEICGINCLNPENLSCANLKPCVQCLLFKTGEFAKSCKKSCNALPEIKHVEALSEDPNIPEAFCRMKDEDRCSFQFKYSQEFIRGRNGRLIGLDAQNIRICPEKLEQVPKGKGGRKWKGFLVCKNKLNDSDTEQEFLLDAAQDFKKNYFGLRNCKFREVREEEAIKSSSSSMSSEEYSESKEGNSVNSSGQFDLDDESEDDEDDEDDDDEEEHEKSREDLRFNSNNRKEQARKEANSSQRRVITSILMPFTFTALVYSLTN